jgi:CHAT domain-containing protein
VQQKLEDNPAYHRLKFDARETGWEKIKKQLKNKKDQAILSYYYTNTQLICFYITASESGFTAIALPEQFFINIADLRSLLETPAGANRKQLNYLAGDLFQLLLQPVIAKIKNCKHLVVIPYNEISYLPFELLRDNAEVQIMLQQFAISYHYSANFLFDENAVSNKDYSVLAMAPFSGIHSLNSILPSLPSSENEIANLPGKLITGNSATKARFIEQSGQYPIIHLATHAVANDTDPLGCYIEFYGEQKDNDSTHRLYEKEIYNLDMQQARLVILSACETGNGLLVNGEGIVSLSRSFSYAGCKSVVTSLWKADDAATAFIMKQLHIYLRKGYAKDEALQQAKLDYLDNPQIDDRFKTPAYWAHMVLIGDQQPVVTTSGNRYTIVLVAILLLTACIVFWYKKNGHSKVPAIGIIGNVMLLVQCNVWQFCILLCFQYNVLKRCINIIA